VKRPLPGARRQVRSAGDTSAATPTAAGVAAVGNPGSGGEAAPVYGPLPFDPAAAVDLSVNKLDRLYPEFSARRVFLPGQRPLIVAGAAVIVIALFIWPILTMQILMTCSTLIYVAALSYRILLYRLGMHNGTLVQVTDDEAAAVDEDDLPFYTVLVPVFKEPEVVGRLVSALAALHYPERKLDVKILLEEDDVETIDAARRSLPGEHIELVLVPDSGPRTKPKACNYGLQTARGEFVTIYDAEDRPDPWQLRRAVVAMRRLGSAYACVQARLGYFNSKQNGITKWFTIEYGSWFRFLLPGLTAAHAPVPLGGTSNHFRTEVLSEIGAWDPYNVTEDADLGIRLARLGHLTGVLDSVTYEEANSDFINWVKQRSRWYKGYLISWLVHMRHPMLLIRQVGIRGFIGVNLFVAGTPLTTVINPFFWAMIIIWYTERPNWMAEVFIAPIFYLAMICCVFGNGAVIYTNVITARWIGRPDLSLAALSSPGYWVMMSMAAVKSVAQLIVNPSYWEKTTHGLDAAEGLSADPATAGFAP
jgi:cellulose synthase/poly-beta-1,6-N-acetylglucosamine synthase-like glycosyltransferase